MMPGETRTDIDHALVDVQEHAADAHAALVGGLAALRRIARASRLPGLAAAVKELARGTQLAECTVGEVDRLAGILTQRGFAHLRSADLAPESESIATASNETTFSADNTGIGEGHAIHFPATTPVHEAKESSHVRHA